MSVIEGLKKTLEKPTAKGKPRPGEADEAARETKPSTFRLKDGGFVPNNSTLPLVVCDAVGVGDALDSVSEPLFQHGPLPCVWGRAR
jgi:hypothetical protein